MPSTTGIRSLEKEGMTKFSSLPMQLRYILLHTASIQEIPIVIVKNSKAGCTTLSQALYHHKAGMHFAGNIHSDNTTLKQGFFFWRENLVKLSARSSHIKLCTVRHPTSRIISAYKDFAGLRNKSWVRHSRAFEAYGILDEPIGARGLLKFLRFVRDSFEYNEQMADRHFRKQTLNIGYNIINYTLIGKIEEINTWGPVYIPSKRFWSAKSVYNSNPTQKPSLSKEIENDIITLYEEDFDAFGYDTTARFI